MIELPETWQVWVAIYAAIVATGALFLEIRRWFEGRPRLHVSVTTPMTIATGPPAEILKRSLEIRVTNRGRSPTTLQSVVLQMYPNRLQWLLDRPPLGVVLERPESLVDSTNDLPYILHSGAQWRGWIDDKRIIAMFFDTNHADRVYVAVYASHTDTPAVERVREEWSSIELPDDT